MKLFGRTGGYYLFWLSVIYLIVGFANIHYKFTQSEFIQVAWIFFLTLPLVVKPVARYFNMRLLWEK